MPEKATGFLVLRLIHIQMSIFPLLLNTLFVKNSFFFSPLDNITYIYIIFL